jgi:tripartite ATP-independent transporter DctP family solute receptor
MKRFFTFGALGLLMLAIARPASADEHVLKLATLAPKGTPWSKLLTKFQKNVQKASQGRIKVKLYLGGTMGDENETVRMASRGRIQAVGASTGAVASLIPELSALEIPFIFRNAKEADYVIDKKLNAPMETLFRERGLVLGFWSENGFRHFGAKDAAIRMPGDLKGKKMRSQESFVHLQMWKALDAAPQAIPTPEVLTALKTGAVDGFDQALLYAIAAGWHNSIKHLTISGHIYQPAVITYNKDWFDALPPDLQQVLLEEGQKIVREGRDAIRKLNPELLEIVKSSGVAVHTLSKSERDAFEKSTSDVRAQFRKQQGKKAAEILDLVEAGVREYRAKAGG